MDALSAQNKINKKPKFQLPQNGFSCSWLVEISTNVDKGHRVKYKNVKSIFVAFRRCSFSVILSQTALSTLVTTVEDNA